MKSINIMMIVIGKLTNTTIDRMNPSESVFVRSIYPPKLRRSMKTTNIRYMVTRAPFKQYIFLFFSKSYFMLSVLLRVHL